jgi:hypothetical protein
MEQILGFSQMEINESKKLTSQNLQNKKLLFGTASCNEEATPNERVLNQENYQYSNIFQKTTVADVRRSVQNNTL